MQSGITIRKSLFALLLVATSINSALADRGDNGFEVLGGAYLHSEVPVYLQLAYVLGFNESTDLSFGISGDNYDDSSIAEVSVGSFYTHRIGDISPQYGFTVGPRIDTSGDSDVGISMRLHLRSVFEVSPAMHLIASYAPGFFIGNSSAFTHLIAVGVRF